MSEFEVTEAERQMIEILREQGDEDPASDFRLTVSRQGGAWDVTLEATLSGKAKKNAGVGPTFDDAWDNGVPTIWG